MVSYTEEAFLQKCGKAIEKLRREANFYLGRFVTDSGEPYTVFGNESVVFRVPAHFGEEADVDRAKSVTHLADTRFWSDDAQRHMQWVPLPGPDELKPGRDKEHPVRCHLAATDMLAAEWVTENMTCATYPFDVQARYLKMALQLAKFKGQKDTRSAYNPLCLWAEDDEGNVVRACIMPMRW